MDELTQTVSKDHDSPHAARSGFRVAARSSDLSDTQAALEEIAAALLSDGGPAPDFVTLHYGGARPADDVCTHAARLFSGATLHGGSSCLGVMTARGAAVSGGDAIGALAIWDPEGAYGTALVHQGADPRAAAVQATRTALDRAGRSGEAPELVWLTTAPGHEEEVLRGIKDVIGQPALILGGSAADNDVTGGWSQLDGDGTGTDAVVVSVLFPTVPFGCSFESGYAPTHRRGTVTEVSGRSVQRIDNRPAAEVYVEWTGGRVAIPTEGSASILAQATMFPLGRLSLRIDDIPFYLLAHPAVAHGDGTLEMFADLIAGQEVWLMEGSEDSLVERAGRIAALSREQLGGGAVSGALMVYCGGCMLSVRDRMNEVAGGVARVMDGAPFLGLFSFGEQGETLSGDSEHGNLMISCITFGSTESRGAQSGLWRAG